MHTVGLDQSTPNFSSHPFSHSPPTLRIPLLPTFLSSLFITH